MAAINLSDVQARAVKELVEKCDLNNKSSIYFKAPTGSGKTFMIANVIDRLIKLHGNKQKLFFIIATLSSGELPKQMEQNLNEYKHALYSIRNIERIESPSINKTKNKDYEPRLVLEQNKVMIFGASTFGKGRILTEYNYLENFIEEIKNEGYKLIYIRDESHHGGEVKNNFVDIDRNDLKNKDQQNEKHFEALIQKAAQYIIKMTATPPRTQNQVVITEKELQTDSIKLIKTEAKRNDFKVDKFLEEISDFDLLQKACEKFKEIKKAYGNAELEPSLINIHPAMLIQVKDKTEKDENFEQNIKEIIKILEQNNLTWVKYFSGDKVDQNTSSIKEEVSLKKISRNNSGVDCIIFKVGPATGWNIPRACMLVQLRNVSSENLNIQTLGRIKRNPNPNYFVDNDDQLFENSIANKYWFYSNFEEKKREWSYYELQEKWKQDYNGLTSFYKGSINKNLLKKVSNTNAYNDELIGVLSKKEILEECNALQQHFREYHYLAPKAELLKNDKNENFRKINDQDKITNSIELELYIENFLDTNKAYFIDATKFKINGWIKSTFLDDPNKPEYISANLVWFVISYLYISQIKQIHKEQMNKYKKTVQEKEFILSKQNSLPGNEYQWINSDLHIAFDNEFDEVKLNYAYQNTYFVNEKEKYKHYLDSHNEEIILNALKNVFKEKYKNDAEDFYNKVKIWTKNPTLHGVNYEYYSKDYDIKNSFPDIVIKYGKHQIIIEVKDGTKDYDKEKTKKIIEAYRAYIDDQLDNSFILSPLTLLVCKVKKEDSQSKKSGKMEITFEGASTNELFNDKINDGTFDKKGLAIENLFKDMFDVIDKLDNN